MKTPPPAIEILARGACVRAGRVLVCRNRKHGNLYLPGGHVDWGEDSKHALAREWREELGVDCRVGHFLGVIEQDYRARSGRTCEISLIFAVHCPQLSAKQNPPAAESHLEFLWIPLGQLPTSGLLPNIMARLIPQWCAQPTVAAKRWRGFPPAQSPKSRA